MWAEFALAFRSLGAVGVFCLSRERRAELMNVGTTCRLLLDRMAGRQDHGQGSSSIELGQMPQAQAQLASSPKEGGNAWQIEERHIQLDVELARGGFGTVWSGRWKENRVAIKVLLAGAVDEEGDLIDLSASDHLWKECAVLQRLDHPHLLKFHGYGTTSTGVGFIVTELMTLGSLQAILADPRWELPWKTRVSIGLQCALGMETLHGIPIVITLNPL